MCSVYVRIMYGKFAFLCVIEIAANIDAYTRGAVCERAPAQASKLIKFPNAAETCLT